MLSWLLPGPDEEDDLPESAVGLAVVLPPVRFLRTLVIIPELVSGLAE